MTLTTDSRDGSRPPAPLSASRKVKTAALAATKLVVVGIALYLIVRVGSSVGWADLRRELATASRLPVLLGIVCLLTRWLIWQHRWSMALSRIGENTRAGRRLAALTASILANHVTPTARVLGGVLRSRYFSRPWGGPFSRVYASVLFDQLMHNSIVGLFTWIAFIAASLVLGRPGLATGAAALLLLVTLVFYARAQRAAVGGAAVDLTSPLVAGPRRTIERLGPLLDHGRETLRLVRALFTDRKLVSLAAAWTALLFVANVMAQFLFFIALGADLAFLEVAAVVGLGGFAGALLGTPGGVGSTEAAMIAMVSALTADRVDAVTGVLLYRGLHYALVFACGVPSLAALEWQRRKRRRLDSEVGAES